MSDTHLTSNQVAAVCGTNLVFPPERIGCGKPIATCAEVFRCTDCEVPFHRDCARQHFGQHEGGPLSERLRNAAREMVHVAEVGPREVNRTELAKVAARILSLADHVAMGERT